MGIPVEPDKYQQAWQAHTFRTRVAFDADVLLNAMRQRHLQGARALTSGLTLVILSYLPVCILVGVAARVPWTWYLTQAAILLGVGLTVIRATRKQRPRDSDQSLLCNVQASVDQVEQDIRSLRNAWWSPLPIAAVVLSDFIYLAWLNPRPAFVGGTVFVFVIFLAAGFLLYYTGRFVIRRQYEPRRQELLALLAGLEGDATGEVPGESPIFMRPKRVEWSPRRRWFFVGLFYVTCLSLAVFLFWLAGGFAFRHRHRERSPFDDHPRIEGPAGASLGRLITDLRKEKNLVGLAAMVTVDGKLDAAAAGGEREEGSGVPVQIGDRWHLGGITKSITATMIARLVESGRMRWSDSLGKIFPDASVHEDWKPVTLGQLLTDTAGAPANFPDEVLRQRPALGPACTQARRKAVLNVIAQKPAYPPGKKFVYSNVGYTIAAAMAEAATGAAWEDLVRREVFEPLRLTQAGFGPPESGDETLEQPRGHGKAPAGKIPMDDKSENTPIMGPSGMIHMTLANLCTYAGEHLHGELGTGKLLSPATYKRLHTPGFDNQACGWVRKDASAQIPCTVYWHNGSNTFWYALVVFAPEKKMVVAVVSNDGDWGSAEAAAWEVVKECLASGLSRQVALRGAGDPK